jgi:hypothetical protein
MPFILKTAPLSWMRRRAPGVWNVSRCAPMMWCLSKKILVLRWNVISVGSALKPARAMQL